MPRSPAGPPARVCPVTLCAQALLGALAAGPALSQLVINEFLPDPAGSDAGQEFVELLNTGDQAVDLAGWQLQFANGADGPVWQTRWTGAAGQAVAPGARFLIVDRGWTGAVAGDAEVLLALQNGPDAIRLARDGAAADAVGYGALADPLMMETAPAPLAVGRAIARRPDGQDTGDNAADFVTTAPTPGRPNFARRLLVAVEVAAEPPSLGRAGEAVAIGAVLRNDGLEPLPTVRVRLARGDDFVEATLDAMAPGSERRVDWTLRPARPGLWPLQVVLVVPGEADTLRVTLLPYQVGPAELLLHEVLAAPRAGQGEWLELAAAGEAPVRLDGYRVRDEDGGWARLPDLVLLPGELAVVAQDSAALAGWLDANAGGPPTARGCGAALRRLGPWPSLNNTAPDTRAWADRVVLADSAGAVLDHVTIDATAGGGDDGRSLERIARQPSGSGASNWAASLAAAGSTPGCANSVTAPTGGPVAPAQLEAVPAAADRTAGDAAIHLRFDVPVGAAGWDLTIWDLDGRRARDLGGDRLGAGPRGIFWDLKDDAGRSVAAGGYVAVLRLVAEGTAGTAPARRLLVVR